MAESIMVACDLHDRTMALLMAQGRGAAEKLSLPNTKAGRQKLLKLLRTRSHAAGGAQVIFAYEASGLGFGLHDELTAAGFACYVLAPTKIARSSQQKRNKTDEKDAALILQLLRGHVLAGNALPKVWVPKPATRDDRELVRARLDLADKLSSVKTQVRCLLKRWSVVRPPATGKGWTNLYLAWLRGLTKGKPLSVGARQTLESLLRQLTFLQEEELRLDEALGRLILDPRYVDSFYALTKLSGVGVLTALVFLTEMGSLWRFRNRRQVGAYLGLVPVARESGEQSNRKGHITRQGPSHVRRVLCQAVWARVRSDKEDSSDVLAYQRIVAKNPQHKKIAVVAVMRRLAVRMWHCGRNATLAAARRRAQSSLGPGLRSGLPLPACGSRPPEGNTPPPRQRRTKSPAGDRPPSAPSLGPQRSLRPAAPAPAK